MKPVNTPAQPVLFDLRLQMTVVKFDQRLALGHVHPLPHHHRRDFSGDRGIHRARQFAHHDFPLRHGNNINLTPGCP